MSYDLEIKGNILVLQTTSFRAEKGSVLHSGIFNRDLSSALAAGAVVMFAGLFLAASGGMTIVSLLAAAVMFGVLFFILRTYLFREPFQEIVVDRRNGTIETRLRRAGGVKKRLRSIADLRDIRLRHVRFRPENADGIRVVEKIALQHGTVLPGFGEAKDFYTVELSFEDGDLEVFSAKRESEAEKVLSELKGFLAGGKDTAQTGRNSREYILNT